MKPAKTGWIVSATIRKSQLAIERSGPGQGVSMFQAQSVIVAPTFMEAIQEFMKSIGNDQFIMALSLNQMPVVEVEDGEPDPKP